jgi:hypothetical protein
MSKGQVCSTAIQFIAGEFCEFILSLMPFENIDFVGLKARPTNTCAKGLLHKTSPQFYLRAGK